MNSDTIEQLLSEKIDKLNILDRDDAISISWFFDDYILYANELTDQIILRIIDFNLAKYAKKEINTLSLYYLIDAVCDKCNSKIKTVMEPKLEKAFLSTIKKKDTNLIGKINELVQIWKRKKLFSIETLTKLEELFKLQFEINNTEEIIINIETPIQISKNNVIYDNSKSNKRRKYFKSFDEWKISNEDDTIYEF